MTHCFSKGGPSSYVFSSGFFFFHTFIIFLKYYLILFERASLLLFKLSKQSHCKVQQKWEQIQGSGRNGWQGFSRRNLYPEAALSSSLQHHLTASWGCISGRIIKGCEYTPYLFNWYFTMSHISSFISFCLLKIKWKKYFNDWVVNENKEAVVLWKLSVDILEINDIKEENEIPEEHYLRLVWLFW